MKTCRIVEITIALIASLFLVPSFALALDGTDTTPDSETKAKPSVLTTYSKAAQTGVPIEQGDYYILRSDTNTQVLDVADGSKKNGANVQLYSSNKTPAQLWRVSYDSAGLYTFVNAKSGKVLDVQFAKTKNGTNVWQYNKNNTLAQKWHVVEDNGFYRIESALNRAYVLDCRGGGQGIRLIFKFIEETERLPSALTL